MHNRPHRVPRDLAVHVSRNDLVSYVRSQTSAWGSVHFRVRRVRLTLSDVVSGSGEVGRHRFDEEYRFPSRTQTNAGEDICESSLGTQFRKNRIDLQIHQPDIPPFHCFVQPLERLFLIAEAGVDRSDCVWRDVTLLLKLLQIVEYLPRLSTFAGDRVRMAQQREHQGTTRKLHARLKLRDRFRIHSLRFVSETQITPRRKRTRIQFKYLATLLDRFVVPSGKIVDPAEMRT